MLVTGRSPLSTPDLGASVDVAGRTSKSGSSLNGATGKSTIRLPHWSIFRMTGLTRVEHHPGLQGTRGAVFVR